MWCNNKMTSNEKNLTKRSYAFSLHLILIFSSTFLWMSGSCGTRLALWLGISFGFWRWILQKKCGFASCSSPQVSLCKQLEQMAADHTSLSARESTDWHEWVTVADVWTYIWSAVTPAISNLSINRAHSINYFVTLKHLWRRNINDGFFAVAR